MYSIALYTIQFNSIPSHAILFLIPSHSTLSHSTPCCAIHSIPLYSILLIRIFLFIAQRNEEYRQGVIFNTDILEKSTNAEFVFKLRPANVGFLLNDISKR